MLVLFVKPIELRQKYCVCIQYELTNGLGKIKDIVIGVFSAKPETHHNNKNVINIYALKLAVK